MASTIGGDDQHHDLTAEQKDQIEKKLRADARELLKKAKQKKERNLLLHQASEISRRKMNIVKACYRIQDISDKLREL